MSQFINNPEHTFGFDTLQLHVGQESADPASDSRAVPIYQTTSYVFRNSQHAADRFGLADAGNIYGRLTNSTQGVFEDRIAALEGGVAGLAVASGAAAITYTLQALAQAGDHVVAQKTIYGGSYNLLEHTLSQFGVETTFVDAHNLEEVEGAIKDSTTVIYLETLGNPNSDIPNIDAISEIAKKHGLPVVVDNTFGTPYLFRPLEHGANIVVHSATKFIGGHGTSLGGVIVDGGNFDWKASGKYAQIAEPNPPTMVFRLPRLPVPPPSQPMSALSCCVTRAPASARSTPGFCSRAPRLCRCALTAMSRTPRRSLSSWLVTATSPR